jgi:hypothetical protein
MIVGLRDPTSMTLQVQFWMNFNSSQLVDLRQALSFGHFFIILSHLPSYKKNFHLPTCYTQATYLHPTYLSTSLVDRAIGLCV